MQCCRPAQLVVLCFAMLVALGACTATTVTPEFVQPSETKVERVAIGEIEAEDELWQLYISHFRVGLASKLRGSHAFLEVLDDVEVTEDGKAELPSDAVLITGTLTEMDKGNAAARWIIGFGAGRAKARGRFQISDTQGEALARFQTWKAYSGGAGIGGASFVSMEDLAQELGEETAASVIRWSRGKPLEPPKEE